MNIETDEAIEIVENALMFYVEEGISSDKKAQKELENAWNIVMSINRKTLPKQLRHLSEWRIRCLFYIFRPR